MKAHVQCQLWREKLEITGEIVCNLCPAKKGLTRVQFVQNRPSKSVHNAGMNAKHYVLLHQKHINSSLSAQNDWLMIFNNISKIQKHEELYDILFEIPFTHHFLLRTHIFVILSLPSVCLPSCQQWLWPISAVKLLNLQHGACSVSKRLNGRTDMKEVFA